ISNLTFVRHYNSQLALIDFGVGFGWTSSFHKRLEIYTNSTVIRARRSDGRIERFSLVGSTWQGDPENTLTLEEDAMGYTLRLKDDSEERYDLTGRIVSETDSNGKTLTYSYNANSRLDSVADDYGRSVSFTYNSDGYLDTLVKPSGETIRYVYDSNRNLQQVEYSPDNVSRTYHYEDPRTTGFFKHYLTGITDERGIRYATFEYNDQNKVSASYHAGNADRVDIVYNTDGNRVVTNSRGYETNYTTLKQHDVTLVTNKSGAGCSTCGNSNISYQYDPSNNNLLSKTDNGVTTEYGNYDAKGNYGYKIEAKNTPEERRFDYTYDPRFHAKVATITEASVAADQQKVTRYSYDNYGNLTNVTVSGFKPDGSPVSRTATYQYNGPLHQLSQYDGPRTDVADITTYGYHAYTGPTSSDPNNGRLMRVTGPDSGNGRIILRDNILYDNTGKVISEDKPNGLHLSYSYYPGNDRLETLTQTTAAKSHTTQWTYLPSGEVASITQAYGSADATTLTFGYDDARRLVRIIDGLGNYIEYTLDTEGNKEAEKIYDNQGALKKQFTQSFDIYNLLDITTQENQSRNDNYAANGELASAVNGNNISSQYDYDALSRLVQMTQDFGGTDPETANTISEYGYDIQDNLTAVIDPNGNTTGYVYDDLGNLLSQTSPDTGTSSFSHDQSGNITSKQDANGNTFTYSYDALNRLTLMDATGTADDISYVYDTCTSGTGRLCSVSMNEISTSYLYDAFGNVTNHQEIDYTYDDANRMKTISYPSGAIITYDYDAAGRVLQVALTRGGQSQVLANNIGHLPFGPVKEIIYGNGLSHDLLFDHAYRLLEFSVSDVFSVNTMQYDGNGNLISRNFDANPETFDYDALNRLDTAAGLFGNRDYDYDKNGNRSQLIADNESIINYDYLSASNMLTSETGWSYSQDPNGNTLDKLDIDGLGWKYTYNTHNRLSSVTQRSITGWEGHGQNQTPIYGDLLVGSYSYNGLGQRISKKANGIETQFTYGLGGELLVEQSGNNSKEYIYLDGQLLSILELSEQSEPSVGEEIIQDDGDIGTTASGIWEVQNDKKGNDYNGDHLLASGGTGSAY
ncbi:MAG: DUF6531 domain-containing protein, partial [Psychromonas sp.]|nr:DUF6531 domain-containing protein [Psychromonas sp.]